MPTRLSWLAPPLLFLLAAALRAVDLDGGAEFDELYHVLAARGWLAHGELRIAEGLYERTGLYTILVAWFFALFGESLEVARLPSVLFAAALAPAVFVWTRATVGQGAAWLAALLVCFWPDGIDVGRFVRFYALHGLVFWLGATGVYALIAGTPRHPRWIAGGTALAFLAAVYLQPVTLIGLLGVVLWAAAMIGPPWLRAQERGRALLVLAGLAVLAVAAAALLLLSGLAGELFAFYRETVPWLAGTRDEFWFYHLQFLLDYPTLWPLTGLAILIGLATRPGPTAFCASVFACAFLVHSFAGPKAMRYVYYTVPFLFVLWATAIALVWPPVWRALVTFAERALAGLGQGASGGRLAAAAVGVVLAAAILFNGVAVKTVAALAGVVLPPNRPPPDWTAARQVLADRLENADVVVTTSELEALYYLDRYDVLVSRSRLFEVGGEEFARDERTGRPVIGDAASLALIIGCHDDGLIISSHSRWRNPVQLDDAAADLVAAQTERLDLAARGLRAYGWDHPDGPPLQGEACTDLPTG